MEIFRKRPKVTIIVLVILVMLIAVRILAPVFLLKKINKDLAEISPTYSLHIERLHLSFIRMFYRFENIEGHLKKGHSKFLDIEGIDVSISWSQLWRGRILTDIEINNASVKISPELFEQSKSPEAKPKEDAANVQAKLFPLRVALVQLRDSQVEFGEFVKRPQVDIWRINGLEGTISNLTATEQFPLTFFNLKGAILGSSIFKATGKMKQLSDPMAWLVQFEMRDFKLAEGNPLYYSYFPITFSQGRLDLFSEAKSEQGKIEGYIKPFFKDIRLAGDHRDFKTLKHFAVEILSSIGNGILRRSKDKSLATRVGFHTENGEFKMDTDEVLDKAIDHGFGKPLSPSLEERMDLK